MGREARLRMSNGEAVALSEVQEKFEPQRPGNFHQSAPVDPAELVEVPMATKDDGTVYTVAASDPQKLYPQGVCVGYAHMGMVHEAFMSSLCQMLRADSNVRSMIGESSCNLPLNRNIILQRFLDTPETMGEWILFLDTDIRFPPYTAAVMVKVAVETKADIVAVPYQLTNGCSTFGTVAKSGGYHTQGAFMYDRAYLIDAAGTGCMMISRDMLRRMKAAYARYEPWPFCGYDRIEINGKPEYESDDYSLCHRAKDLGARIVGYTGVVLSHMKTHPLVFNGLEDAARMGA